MIVLDTHAWIWWAAGSRKVSARARRAIEAAPVIGISPLSCWEIGMLVARGRLELDRGVLVWIKQALALPKIELVPISPEVACRAATLGEDFPGDPADRLIAATAIERRARLVTRDKRLRQARGVATTW